MAKVLAVEVIADSAKGALPKAVMLFDGDCALCNRAVLFIKPHLAGDTLGFAPLQSPVGQAALATHGLPSNYAAAMGLVQPSGKLLLGDNAAFALAAHLHAPWRWLGILRFLPKAFTQWAYGYVAKHRYAWFGQADVCQLGPI